MLTNPVITAVVAPDPFDINELIERVVEALPSAQYRRLTRGDLRRFWSWYMESHQSAFNRSAVLRYRAHLQDCGKAPRTINQAMTSIRKLAEVACEFQLIDPVESLRIVQAKGVRNAGTRTGNWLSREQAQALLDAPDIRTLKGVRDRAILSIFLGAGLRRFEVAALTIEHVQQRDGRWVLLDFRGKGSKVGSVPIAPWVKDAIDDWTEAAGIESGPLCLAIKHGKNQGGPVQASHLGEIVHEYSEPLGLRVTPHDLRRTFAKLARKGGASLEQISMALRHKNLITTQRYLGLELDLQDTASDHLGLHL